jgi:hypothetical protein
MTLQNSGHPPSLGGCIILQIDWLHDPANTSLPICRTMQPLRGWYLQDDAASRFAG